MVEIADFISAENEVAARRLMSKFNSAFRLLARSPLIGRERNDLGAALRSLPLGNYVVIYRVVSRGIIVARVLSGFRNLPDLFQ